MIQAEVVDKIGIYFMFNKFFTENHTVYDIMWKRMVDPDRPQMAIGLIRHMRSACNVNKATDTSSEYIIILAFARQKWLRERASILRYTCVACLVICHKGR